MTAKKDARKHERVIASLPAQLKLVNVAGVEQKASVADLSLGGACLTGEDLSLKVGERIAFLLDFQFSRPSSMIAGFGEVRRIQRHANGQWRVGVQFTSIDLRSLQRISEIVGIQKNKD